MEYPNEFIKKVKSVYPHYRALHECLDNGMEIVGRYLDDSSDSAIPIRLLKEIKTMKELKITIYLYERKKSLYTEWCILSRKHRFTGKE